MLCNDSSSSEKVSLDGLYVISQLFGPDLKGRALEIRRFKLCVRNAS